MASSAGASHYVLKTADEYAADTKTPVVNSKKYFKHKRLQVSHSDPHSSWGRKPFVLTTRVSTQTIVGSYPYGRKLSKEEVEKEDELRKSFLHFVIGLLEINPWKRWSPRQAAEHPFIKGTSLPGLCISWHAGPYGTITDDSPVNAGADMGL
jgi:hypothetical protein